MHIFVEEVVGLVISEHEVENDALFTQGLLGTMVSNVSHKTWFSNVCVQFVGKNIYY
jgi:hypothetical protein